MLTAIGIAIIACLLLIAYQIGQLPKNTAVNITVSPAEMAAPIIKVLLPADIQKVSQDAHRVEIGQKQPDGSVQWIGHVDAAAPYDRPTWPERLEAEWATLGRVLRLPDGQVIEGVQE